MRKITLETKMTQMLIKIDWTLMFPSTDIHITQFLKKIIFEISRIKKYTFSFGCIVHTN